ncbi:MAG: transposase [Chitinophagales bacterium]
MASHIERSERNEIYFVTFTYYKWLPLIEKSQTYFYVEKWFEYLNLQNCDILAYVVMPNHFHAILHIKEECKISLSTIIGNGKRFWAYEIIKKLEELGEKRLLSFMRREVTNEESIKGYNHRVFKYSFDSKICYNPRILETKLDYIHHNPVNGKWNLIDDYTKYKYSSASFYELQIPNKFITHYMDIL